MKSVRGLQAIHLFDTDLIKPCSSKVEPLVAGSVHCHLSISTPEVQMFRILSTSYHTGGAHLVRAFCCYTGASLNIVVSEDDDTSLLLFVD